MSEVSINVAGAIVYWSCGTQTSLSALRDCLTKHGFGNLSPERMTDGAALRAALAETYEGHKVFPIDIEDKTAFEVVHVTANEATIKNEYLHVLTAAVSGTQAIEVDNYDDDLAQHLTGIFQRNISLVPTSQLTKVLVDVVAVLGGVTMRPAGGIYWIPDANWDRWRKFADDIELTGPKNRCDACRVILDEACLKAVREALSNEVAREAKSIEETLNDPKTGMRAASTARKRAQDLQDKIGSYEAAFSIGLTDLSSQLQNAVKVEATATLMDAAHQMFMFSGESDE